MGLSTSLAATAPILYAWLGFTLITVNLFGHHIAKEILKPWKRCRKEQPKIAQQTPFMLHSSYLFHDLLLRFNLYHCVWSVITAHNLTPEKRENIYSSVWAPYNPQLRASAQHSSYNWHLALLWVSVMHTLTRSSITVSRVSTTF